MCHKRPTREGEEEKRTSSINFGHKTDTREENLFAHEMNWIERGREREFNIPL